MKTIIHTKWVPRRAPFTAVSGSPWLLLATMLMFFAANSAFAGNATWLTSPVNGNWNSAPNWSPITVPNSPADTATFDSSSISDISISRKTEVNGIVFSPLAQLTPYTITARPTSTLMLSGVGITNNSGVTQNFVSAGHAGNIEFRNNATAGSQTAFTNKAFGLTVFSDHATAGNATINNNGGTAEFSSGLTIFFGANATAGNATITNNAGRGIGETEGETIFRFGATAASATITNNGSTVSGAPGGLTAFEGSSAGNATLIANSGSGGGKGGKILFQENATGGTARVEVFGNGSLDIIGNRGPLTIGSIEGTGNVLLGANNLTVGNNELSTVFSGVMQDGGSSPGTGGSFIKVGMGTLALSGANTYTGGTTINGGVLQVDNTSGSGTGPGPVTVNSGGKLRGTGTIAGDLTNGGVVAPGTPLGTLHLGENFFQDSGGTLEIEIANLFSFDQLMVSGTASLDGTLDVTLDGYTGHAGDIFTILTSSGLSGNFTTFDLPTLGDGLFFSERVTSNDVLLTVNGPTTGVPDQGFTLLLMAGALGVLLGIQRFSARPASAT